MKNERYSIDKSRTKKNHTKIRDKELLSLNSKETVWEQGFYVPNLFVNETSFPESKSLLVTLHNKTEIKDKYIEMISDAKKCIKICSFLLEDKDIVNALINKADTSSVGIFIITAIHKKKIQSSILNDTPESALSINAHFESIVNLSQRGVHIRASDDAHSKFIITDHNACIISSANITHASLNINPESGAYITCSKSVSDLENIYNVIYKEGTEYPKFTALGTDKEFIEERVTNISISSFKDLNNSSIRITYKNIYNSIYSELINIINNSKKELLLSTFSIVGLNNLDKLYDSLNHFISNGGKVVIFSRAMNYRYDHLTGCQELANIGCVIYGDVYNHSKGIISDTNQGMLFSANIDGNHGLVNGFETGLLLNNYKKIFSAYKKFLQWQINNAPYIFTQSCSQEDLINFYLDYSNKKYDSSIVMQIEQLKIVLPPNKVYYKEQIIELFSKSPVFCQKIICKRHSNKVVFRFIVGTRLIMKKTSKDTYEYVAEATDEQVGDEAYLAWKNLILLNM